LSTPDRDDLIHLLSEAAETEHMLCCQYLFAGCSLRTEGLTWEQQAVVHDWGLLLFTIARQEMEHLGLVCNLLTSLGAAPHFVRPNFPQGPKYFPVPMKLERLSEASIRRFIRFERPTSEGRDDEPQPGPEFVPSAIHSIEDLYDRISTAIDEIPLTDAELFVGPPNGQVDGNLLHVNWPRPGALGGIWDVTLFDILDRPTAQKAIELIVEQGEGAPQDTEFTHYRWFCEMLEQYRALKHADPEFDPARPVVENPCLYVHDDAPHARLVTHPTAREVLDLFNGVYELLLLLLIRLYAHTDEDTDEVTALAYALFPLMTQVMRPVAMLLTTLPADEHGGPERAGPGFEITRAVHFLPHRQSALALLDERFKSLSAQALALGEAGVSPRLSSIGANLEIMAAKFAAVAAGTYPPPLLQPGVIRPYSQG